jgi:serine phosphatase RsbU (regulator of sigma subunit)/predicted ester cyclase
VNKSSINAPNSFGWHHTNGVGGSEKTRVEEDKAPVSEVQERNKALVRRLYELDARGDIEAMEKLLAPDFVDHSLVPDQDPGREGYLHDGAKDHTIFSNIRYIIEDQLAEGDKVMSRITANRIHDRGMFLGVAPTGMELKTTGIVIHRIARGKIVEEWSESRGTLEATRQRLEQERIERERVEQELQVARRIQQASLPKVVPQLEGWQITPFYRPAREVGGDFYDFHPLSEGRLGLIVGDATGKGVPAALVMSTTLGMLQAVSEALDSSSSAPGEVLSRVNEALAIRIPPNMFVTCFYAILEPKSGTLTYANAGHDLPCLRHGDGDAEELRARGMPLGLMAGMGYEEKETILEVGESALFYSDGLVEAHDPKGEMFGFPRLRALIAERGEEGSLGDFLMEELHSFVGEGWEQEDYITLLTLERSAT